MDVRSAEGLHSCGPSRSPGPNPHPPYLIRQRELAGGGRSTRKEGAVVTASRLQPPGLVLPAYALPSAPLGRHNSFRLNARAEYLVVPRSVPELVAVQAQCRKIGLTIRTLGHGTNTLFHSEYLVGLTLQLSAPEFTGTSVNGALVTAGAGTSLQRLVSMTVRAGLRGIETLAGIPGTLGGAIGEKVFAVACGSRAAAGCEMIRA